MQGSWDVLARAALLGCACFSILITAMIIGILAYETARFFGEVSVVDFLTGLEWNPLLGEEKHFGIWPLISCSPLRRLTSRSRP